MGSTFGKLFCISTFGESHGGGVGVVLDGCPPRLPISLEEIQLDLDRRRPGQSRLTTPRQEADKVEILSGVFDGKTLGTPIGMLVRNQDARSSSYEDMKDLYRPLFLIETPIVITSLEAAELIKYAANAFLATKITFINEIANLCDAIGCDVHDVARGMGMDNRIGRKFLHPGPGYGERYRPSVASCAIPDAVADRGRS